MALIRGDSQEFSIPITNTGGGPMNLTGCTVKTTVRSGPGEEVLYSHSITISGAGAVTAANGLALGAGGVAAGIVVDTISPAESELFRPGAYKGDVEVRLANGKVYTPLFFDEAVIADYSTPAG